MPCKALTECWRKQAIQALLMFACISGVFCPTFLLSLTTGSQLLATFKALNVTCRCQLSHQEPYRPLFYDSDVIWTVWFIWKSAYKTSQDVTLLDRLTRCAENGQGVLASAVTCQSQHLGHSYAYFSVCEHRSHIQPLVKKKLACTIFHDAICSKCIPILAITTNHMITQSKASGHSRLALQLWSFNNIRLLGKILSAVWTTQTHTHMHNCSSWEVLNLLSIWPYLYNVLPAEIYFKMRHQILFITQNEMLMWYSYSCECVWMRRLYVCFLWCGHGLTFSLSEAGCLLLLNVTDKSSAQE